MLAVLAASGLPAAEGPWQRNDQSALRLVTPYEVAVADGEFWFGVEFELAPHWHVYWQNSGDAGYPPALDTAATPQLSDVELLFPAPERYHLPGGLLAFGYEDSVIYPVRAEIDAESETLDLTVNLDYVVCEVECIPYNYDLTLTQPLGTEASADALQEGRLSSWRQRVPHPGPALVAPIEADGEQKGRLVLDLPFAARDLFFLPQDLLNLGEPSILPTEAGSRAELTLSRLDVGRPLPEEVELEWTATAAPDSDAAPGQSGSLAVTTPVSWRQSTRAQAGAGAAATSATVPSSAWLWWYWLPALAAAGLFLASGALKASPAVLRTAWVAGIFSVAGGWYLLSRTLGHGDAAVSMPVVAMGSWLLIVAAVIAFAGKSFSGGVPMALASAVATFALLPAAPGIGWTGVALLVLVVIAARPQLDSPSRLALGLAGFFALLAVVARFYLLSGSVPPTPLAGIQIGLLASAAGAWMTARGRRPVSRVIGWLLIAAGAVCVLYFVL